MEEERRQFTGGRVRPHKGSGALLIRELIGMPRMPTTMERGLGYPPRRGWGVPRGSWKSWCNPGIGGAYISRRGCSSRYRGLSPPLFSLAVDFDPHLRAEISVADPKFSPKPPRNSQHSFAFRESADVHLRLLFSVAFSNKDDPR